MAKSTKTAKSIEIELFTDGACSGNPGPGGWAYVIRHLPTGKESENYGADNPTTNNRMELQAVIEGLSTLKRSCIVELFTDSTYVGKGISEWMTKWKVNNWHRKERNKLVPVKNDDLWKQLDELLQKHEVKFTWIRGHSGHPENERCDELAVRAYQEL
jgi:ribonuclease HI